MKTIEEKLMSFAKIEKVRHQLYKEIKSKGKDLLLSDDKLTIKYLLIEEHLDKIVEELTIYNIMELFQASEEIKEMEPLANFISNKEALRYHNCYSEDFFINFYKQMNDSYRTSALFITKYFSTTSKINEAIEEEYACCVLMQDEIDEISQTLLPYIVSRIRTCVNESISNIFDSNNNKEEDLKNNFDYINFPPIYYKEEEPLQGYYNILEMLCLEGYEEDLIIDIVEPIIKKEYDLITSKNINEEEKEIVAKLMGARLQFLSTEEVETMCDDILTTKEAAVKFYDETKQLSTSDVDEVYNTFSNYGINLINSYQEALTKFTPQKSSCTSLSTEVIDRNKESEVIVGKISDIEKPIELTLSPKQLKKLSEGKTLTLHLKFDPEKK